MNNPRNSELFQLGKRFCPDTLYIPDLAKPYNLPPFLQGIFGSGETKDN